MTNGTPPPASLAWAAGLAGPEASAHVVQRLAGGTHASTHLLETVNPSRQMVLRRYPSGDSAAAREAHVLTMLDGLGGWAPQLLDVDPDGTRFGEPATLITRLPGRADIMPASPTSAAVQLGHALARLHAVPVDNLTGLRESSWALLDDAGPSTPILAEHGDRLASTGRVLTHFDFWSGNVLWQDDRLTGIVDWSGAALAPRGHDVSWCRLDLILLYGSDMADVFTSAYEETAGQRVSTVVLWDLVALNHSDAIIETWVPNYAELGRIDLTATELRARHTAWTDECLRRYAGL